MNEYKKLNVAIIGGGRWGKKHIKTAVSLLESDQVIVCDIAENTTEAVKSICQNIKFTTDINTVLNDKSISAVIIATPADTHFEIAKKCLNFGKHVLVEKPITLVPEDAEELHLLAKALELKLMVGHVLLYHPAILRIKKDIDNGKLGKLQYIYSNRLNLGAIRSEENILWSFAPHDISIMQFLIGSYPIEINAQGSDFIQNGIEDTTVTYLKYNDGISAHIFVSWLHPFKEQRLVVVGERGMYVFDDTIEEEKLKYYDKGFVKINGSIEKFDYEYVNVELENKMPLTEEQIHFYDSIINDSEPRTNCIHALEVLRILNEATTNLKENKMIKEAI